MQMLVQYKWEAPELDKIWKGLYQENSYIFPYSSREYNENIFKYISNLYEEFSEKINELIK